MNLVELQKISPKIRLEILYATPRNFTGQAVYTSGRCLLISQTADRLHKVQLSLEKKGLGLKVYDGYRPFSVQKIFWKLVPDPRYVADPAVGSRHNRGTSVDVGLVDAQGRDLPMPTPFDEFSHRAHHNYQGCAPEEAVNRALLTQAMTAQGFLLYPDEWWHFDDPDWEKFPLLDLAFGEL